jgi:MFS family permease
MNSAIKNMELKDMITLRTWMVVASVLTVIVVLSIQEAVIQLALPIISKDLNVAYSSLSIIITGYWLTYGVSSLPLGKLGDLLSHRLIFLLASIMLGGLSILCGVIPSWESLAIFRTLAGVCVAALTANGVSILRSSFGEGRRAQVTSLWAATISLSFIVGPSLGGVFIDFAKWEYIFTLEPISKLHICANK